MGKVGETDGMRVRHLVSADGAALAHYRVSQGDGRRGAAFVAHGQAHHTLNMRGVMEGLAERGWNVHGVDMRGHGHSAGPRAPLGHMEIGAGWERLAGDMRTALLAAFEGVPWEDRLVVAPNIGALLVLEALKGWSDLASHIVFVTPPPNQPALVRLAQGFIRARSLMHAADAPDELTLHQLYGFLGAQLRDRERLIDVVSADPEVTDALLEDELAWPTPTTGYFHEMFRGMKSAWDWPKGARVREGTRVLLLYGGDDPVTANGNFVGPMRRHFERIGVASVDARRVEGGRPGLILDERTLGISGIVADWCDSTGGTGAAPPEGTGPGDAEHDRNLAGVSADVLARLGLDGPDGELDADELVELCYHAVDDETRWIEMLYRVAYALEGEAGAGRKREAEIERILLALMPHWERSFRLNRQIMRSAALGAVLENVIDRFRIGMAIVNPDMNVSYANDAFLSGLAGLAKGRVATPVKDAKGAGHALVALTDPAFRAKAARGEALWMLDGEAVGFHFRPVALKQTALQRGGAAGVLILRTAGAGEGPDARVELLEFAYGLTKKEAEAATGLLDGLSPDGISQRLGVSIHTTRTHLRRVYEKTGVQGQTELTARLLGGPLGLIVGADGRRVEAE